MIHFRAMRLSRLLEFISLTQLDFLNVLKPGDTESSANALAHMAQAAGGQTRMPGVK